MLFKKKLLISYAPARPFQGCGGIGTPAFLVLLAPKSTSSSATPQIGLHFCKYYAIINLSQTVDFIVEGLDRSKAVMIITEKPKDITSALIEEFGCGTTNIPAVGGYSSKEKTVVYFIVNRFEIAKTKAIVHAVDPSAFMTITEVADVFVSTSLEKQ